jgi:hypothetical protein
VPAMVTERPVIAAVVAKALRTAAAMKSFHVPGESSPLIVPSTERTPWRMSFTWYPSGSRSSGSSAS